MTAAKTLMKNGLTGQWEQPRLKSCATCGIMFETAQRTKKYCSRECSPRRSWRVTDNFVEQYVVWVCKGCHERFRQTVLVKESTSLRKSDYMCDECLRSHPLSVIFGDEGNL